MATNGIGALLKKLFMSSASSAIGTGTVLGIHSAMAPSDPTFQRSDLRDASVDESRNLMKVNMDASSSYFTIVMFALLSLVMMVTIATCCGCSPAKLARRESEEKWKDEIRSMMEKRNREDAEQGLETEGWTEVNKKTVPKLVEE